MADLPWGLSGMLAMRQANEATSANELKGILSQLQAQGAMTKMAQEQQFRSEISSARTPEEQLAVAVKYGGPEGITKHFDRLALQDQNKQLALSRLTQQAAAFQDRYDQRAQELAVRARNATSTEERTAIERDSLNLRRAGEAFKQSLQSQSAGYNFGFLPQTTVSAPAAAAPSPAPSPGLGGMLATNQPGPAPAPTAGPGLGALSEAAAGVPAALTPTPASLYGAEGRFPRNEPVAAPTPGGLTMGNVSPREYAPAEIAQAERIAAENRRMFPEQPGAAVAPAGTPAPAPTARPLTLADAPPDLTPRKKQEWLVKNSGSSGAAAMGPDAIKVAGWEKLLYGTDPKGLGTASAQQRAQVADERARIGKGLGLSDTEMAMLPQDNRVKMKAVDQLTRWAATVGRGAEKLALDLDVAISYAEKLPLSTLQMVNRGVIAGLKEFNNPDANAYATALNSVRLEYGRLMSGPTSNAMLPVEAMKIGNELVSKGVNVAALREIGVQMKRDAANTITATNSQISGLRGTISAPAPNAPFMTPGGASPSGSGFSDAEKERRYQEWKAQQR